MKKEDEKITIKITADVDEAMDKLEKMKKLLQEVKDLQEEVNS